MKKIIAMSLAAMLVFASCDILAGFIGDDNEEEDAKFPDDKEEPGTVSPILPRKLVGMNCFYRTDNSSSILTFEYDDANRLVKIKEVRTGLDFNGDGQINFEDNFEVEAVYEYSDNTVKLIKKDSDETTTTVFTVQDRKVVKAESNDCRINYKYEDNYLVGYDRVADEETGSAVFGVEDHTLKNFSSEIEFTGSNERWKNEGTLVPSVYKNNLSIDLYPVFVYLGETFYPDHLPVFMMQGMARYEYLPEKVQYVFSDNEGTREEREDTYNYELSGDYIMRVTYSDNGDVTVYEFKYE